MCQEQEIDRELTPWEVFSRMGLALFIMSVVTVVSQAALLIALEVLEQKGIINSSWVLWLGSFLPLYLVGIPAGVYFLDRVPAYAIPKRKLGVGRVILLFVFCFPAMYLGNLIGMGLAKLLSGGQATNMLDTFVYDSNPIRILVLVIIAPIVEEFLFRKVLIERALPYGELLAVLFSAVVFALFHMNLFQIPYTFLLGAILAYLYLRTGRLVYPVAFHIIINFLGSVVAPFLISKMDMTILNQVLYAEDQAAMEALAILDWSTAMYMLYTIALPLLSIVGVVLFILRRKKLVFEPQPYQLPREGRMRLVYGNRGMLAYILFCLAIVVVGLLPGAT